MAKRVRPLHVLLVENDPQVRAAIGTAVAAEPLLELVTVCLSKDEAMRFVRERTLDIALVGMQLPDGSGLEVVEAVNRHQPASDIVVIGTSDDKDVIFSSMQVGATGCLMKEALLRQNGVQVNSLLAGLLFSSTPGAQSEDQATNTRVEVASLPRVQREILRCLLRGLSNKEIARDLVLTSYNVDYHLKCLRKRFAVHNRVQLVGTAMSVLDS